MNAAETPRFEDVPDFGMECAMGEFDINAAFQEAVTGVVGDVELALEEKVRRMESIVSEGTSEVYRNFVDFRAMAAQMKMLCSHDHALSQSIQGSEMLSSFLDSYKADDGHNHTDDDKSIDDEYEIDPKTGKKTKKKKAKKESKKSLL